MTHKLILQYGLDGEHPDFPSAMWLAAARDGHTRDGYWSWVASNVHLQEDPPRVWVVMGNDYPDSVFSTEEKAEDYVDRMRKKTPKRIHWKAYDFKVDEEGQNLN